MRVEGLSDAEIASRPHRIRGSVANALLDRAAIAPDRATRYVPSDRAAEQELAKLRVSGAVKFTIDGRCWFDLRRHYMVQADCERMRAMIAVPVAIIAALVATLFYQG